MFSEVSDAAYQIIRVIPAKARIQFWRSTLGPGLRRGDDYVVIEYVRLCRTRPVPTENTLSDFACSHQVDRQVPHGHRARGIVIRDVRPTSRCKRNRSQGRSRRLLSDANTSSLPSALHSVGQTRIGVQKFIDARKIRDARQEPKRAARHGSRQRPPAWRVRGPDRPILRDGFWQQAARDGRLPRARWPSSV